MVKSRQSSALFIIILLFAGLFLAVAPLPVHATSYNYYMAVSGSNYQMLSSSQTLLYQSTDSAQVFSDIVGNCSSGATVEIEAGTYAVNTMWTTDGYNNITFDFQSGSLLIAGNDLDTAVLMVGEPDTPSSNIVLNGITIDGNAANQVINNESPGGQGTVIGYPGGVLISGSNDEVLNPDIYDCRVMGVQVDWVNLYVSGEGYEFTENASSNDGVQGGTINNCNWNSVTFYGANNDYCYDCNIYNDGDVGISCTGTYGGIVEGNYVHDMAQSQGSENSHWGIAVEGYGNCAIENNVVYNCIQGIETTGLTEWNGASGFNVIENNTVSCALNYTAYYGGGSLQTQGIEYPDGFSFGIILGCNYDEALDNTVYQMIQNQTDPYYIGGLGMMLGANYTVCSGNTVSYCQAQGIIIEPNCINNTIIGNDVFDNVCTYPSGGIQDEGQYSLISGNTVYNTVGCTTQTVGIFEDAYNGEANNGIIMNNDAYNNPSDNYLDVNTACGFPQSTMINDAGYNPFGTINMPILAGTDYLADSGTSTVFVSGTTYINSGSAKQLNLTAQAPVTMYGNNTWEPTQNTGNGGTTVMDGNDVDLTESGTITNIAIEVQGSPTAMICVLYNTTGADFSPTVPVGESPEEVANTGAPVFVDFPMNLANVDAGVYCVAFICNASYGCYDWTTGGSTWNYLNWGGVTWPTAPNPFNPTSWATSQGGTPTVYVDMSAGSATPFSVTQNGNVLYASTSNCTVTLQPGDTFSVTFTSAPTITVTGLLGAGTIMSLVAGWNQVSFSVVPSNAAFSSILSGIGYEVRSWSGTSYTTPTSAVAGQSYWIFVPTAHNLPVIGTPSASCTVALQAGWNMLGSVYDQSLAASSVFTGYYQLLTWTGTSYQTATTIGDGQGYWVFVLQSTEITLQ
jgi:parallel beta-helix repeat protein